MPTIRRAAHTCVGVILLHTLVACTPESRSGYFRPPREARVVGGGHSIEFVAPADGVVYLTNHGQLALSKSVVEGEKVQWLGTTPLSPKDGWELSSTARLYFEPWHGGACSHKAP